MERHTKDLAFVLPDELLEGGCVPVLGAGYKRHVRVYLFRSWGLDGGHGQKGAKTGLKFYG